MPEETPDAFACASQDPALRPLRQERRSQRRIRFRLQGRFLLPDGTEHPCEAVDATESVVAFFSETAPQLGDRIVVYVEQLGRLDGVVKHRKKDRFALALTAGDVGQKKYAARLAALVATLNARAMARYAAAAARQNGSPT